MLTRRRTGLRSAVPTCTTVGRVRLSEVSQVYAGRSISNNYRGFRPSSLRMHSCSQLGSRWDRMDLGEVPGLKIITLLNSVLG